MRHMEKTYSSGQAAALFGVNPETIRRRAEAFSEYLSVNANPGKGRERRLTEDDMRVLSLVHQMNGEGLSFEDIRPTLAAGQRGDIPEKTTLARQQQVALADEYRARVAELQIRLEMSEDIRREQQRQIGQLQREIGRLEEQLKRKD